MKAKIIGSGSLEPVVPEMVIDKNIFLSIFPFQQHFKQLSAHFFLFIIISLLFNISACDKDDVAPDTPDTSIKDIDGNVYTSVKIGTQEWMVENLKVTKYRNGDAIPHIKDTDNSWSALTSGAYSNDYEGTNKNGRLYNWYAVNDSRILAPKGWHIPTEADWTVLINFLGGVEVAGSKMKEKGTAHWCPPNSDATNESGFTALPGDWRIEFGFATGCGDESWWSADEDDVAKAHNLFIFDGSGEVSRVTNDKYVGWGVRCIKD